MTEELLSFARDMQCGMCRAPGRLLVYYVAGDETRALRKIDADFPFDCRQTWLEEGRSPVLGLKGPADRKAKMPLAGARIEWMD